MARLYLTLRVEPDGPIVTTDYDAYLERVFHPCIEAECSRCGRMHDQLWTVQRVMLPTGLYWSAARLNGARVLIDGSLPTTVERLPRDARPVGPADSARLWHDENESHVFGGPNVAAALRATIAEHNRNVGPNVAAALRHTIAADSDGWSGR